MKLLSVITTMNPTSGGPAQGIRNNIFYSQQNGLETYIVSLDPPDMVFNDGLEVIKLGGKANKWYYSSKLLPWLLNNLSLYEVVLVHGLWQYNGYAVYKAITKLCKTGKKVPKVFVMSHGMLDPYFQQSKKRQLKAIRNTLYWHLIEKKLINSANGILFTCEEELQLAKTTFNDYHPKAEYNIGYGIVNPPANNINLKNAFLEKCEVVAEKKYFLFISRIHQKKGVDILIDAYAILVNKFKETDVEIPILIIAGPGIETDYGIKILEAVNLNSTLIKRVFFPGMLQGDAKWGAFYNAEAFVLPSHQENFGIAIVEAMACKKAVLITNKVNIWREIENGKGGLVCDNNLTSVLASLMQWVSLSITDKEKMGSNAFDIYQSHFTAEATSKKFVEVIKNGL